MIKNTQVQNKKIHLKYWWLNTKYHESQHIILQSSPCFAGPEDYKVLINYIGKNSPLTTGIEGNIQIIQENQWILIQKSGHEEGKRMPFFYPSPHARN